MNAKDLRDIAIEFNSHEEEVFDKAADIVATQGRNQLEEMYNSGNWAIMIGATCFSVVISSINEQFNRYTTYIDWIMHGTETYQDYDDLKTFEEIISKENLSEVQLVDRSGEEIFQLSPLVDALERKGFKCYVDVANYNLLACVELPKD